MTTGSNSNVPQQDIMNIPASVFRVRGLLNRLGLDFGVRINAIYER